MTGSLTAEYFTDPFSPRCWAAEPVVRRLTFAYDAVDWVPRPVVLFPDTAEPEQLPYGLEGVEALDELGRTLADGSGMPFVPALWADDPPSSSRPACEAVAAVRERAPDAAWPYLRRLRERAFVEADPPDDSAVLAALAETVPGVDARSLERDLADGVAREAVTADLERARETAELRGRVDTRGSIELLPYRPRRGADEPASGGYGDQPSGPTGAGEDDGTGRAVGDAADGVEDEDPDEPGDVAADDGGAPEPTVVGPPSIRFESDGTTVIAAIDAGYGLLKDAVNKLDPEIRNTAVDHAPHGTREMTRRGISPELAERMVGGDYAGRIRRYLSRFGRAFMPEIEAGVDASRTTCRLTLLEMETDGVVEKVSLGDWDAWELADGARR